MAVAVALRWPRGAIAGGYGGAGVAKRIGLKGVRLIVIGVGFSMALSLLIR
jgi:hypothetical protein